MQNHFSGGDSAQLKMPSLDTEDALDQLNEENRGDNTLSGPIIGIIYPPPEVRSILNLKNRIILNV